MLHDIAKQMVADHKGLLAADESTGTIQKRFDAIGVENTESNRQAYRELLFTAPRCEEYISGVILFDETFRQVSRDGVPFVALLAQKGILPGIKVDMGTEPFASGSTEVVTKGLEGLPERLAEYAAQGAKFTKWRAVITIGEGIPTQECILENMRRLAQYATLVQDAGMVPIVEPEVLMDGAHTSSTCAAVTHRTLHVLFEELAHAQVNLSGCILKPNFVVPGNTSLETFDPDAAARETLAVLEQTVPYEVPGIMFLSGGLSEAQVGDVLRIIHRVPKSAPWALSFSYGRALQSSALAAWGGKTENISAGQDEFVAHAQAYSTACGGV
jgi:fructose-bisphosphate aldolase, class I